MLLNLRLVAFTEVFRYNNWSSITRVPIKTCKNTHLLVWGYGVKNYLIVEGFSEDVGRGHSQLDKIFLHGAHEGVGAA